MKGTNQTNENKEDLSLDQNQKESEEKIEQTEKPKKKLKPVIFEKGEYRDYYRNNPIQQKKLLKAMSVSDDPKEWKQMIGVKTMVEVYRTLDKLAIRKEYHEALARQGIDFDIIINGIKDIAQNAIKDDTRLKGWQIILKSLGVDKYEVATESSKDWEKLILEASSDGKQLGTSEEEKSEAAVKRTLDGDYDVVEPVIPQDIQDMKKDEQELGKELYGG